MGELKIPFLLDSFGPFELTTQSIAGECCFKCNSQDKQLWYRCETFDDQSDYCGVSFSGQTDHICRCMSIKIPYMRHLYPLTKIARSLL